MVLNPFLINNWKLTEALKAVFILLIALWALVGLDVLGVHLPLLRGIFGVVYVLFVPGLLILRALRAHRFDSERTLLFAIGLSIATIMFTGLFMNVVYPHIHRTAVHTGPGNRDNKCSDYPLSCRKLLAGPGFRC